MVTTTQEVTKISLICLFSVGDDLDLILGESVSFIIHAAVVTAQFLSLKLLPGALKKKTRERGLVEGSYCQFSSLVSSQVSHERK